MASAEEGSGTRPKGSGSKHDDDTVKLNIQTKARQYIRQRVTRLCNKLGNEINTSTFQQKLRYIDNLRDLRKELSEVHNTIFGIMIRQNYDDTMLDDLVREHEERYDDRIQEWIDTLMSSCEDQSPQQPDNVSINNNNGSSRLRLPEVKLPTFSGSANEEFDLFISSFESILSKHNLSNHEKYVHLLNQLSGPPKKVVVSLRDVDQNYDNAKKILTDYFSSEEIMKYAVIDRLVKMKMSKNELPYDFIGDVNELISAYKRLHIESDTFCAYFIWKGMNTELQDEYIRIVDNSQPTLNDILDNMSKATRRYVRSIDKTSKVTSKFKSVNYTENSEVSCNAINAVKKDNRVCYLCRKDNKPFDHFIGQCRVYDTPASKMDKIRLLKGCTKCSYLSHETSKCHFKFNSKCKNCNGQHMTFLCSKNTSSRSSEVASNSITLRTYSVHSGDNIMLPTLTCSIRNSHEKFRAFVDGGSQRSFISQQLFDKYNFSVISQVKVKINGINSSKLVDTMIVDVPLVVGDTIVNVHAIVSDDINIQIKTKNMHKLVNSFVNKNYKLADEYLENGGDDVDMIECIIGANDSDSIETGIVKFGNCRYIITPGGIMLTGNIEKMLDNIGSLPEYESKISGSKPLESNCFSVCSYSYDNDVANVVDINGDIIKDDLKKATSQILNEQCMKVLDCEKFHDEKDNTLNDELVDYTLRNTSRNETGRFCMPLMWNSKIAHRLGSNYNLSRKILESNTRKLLKSDKIIDYDKVFREQEKAGVIERIDNLNDWRMNHPEASFIPHMGIFKPEKETTKTRVVFLSNLVESSPDNPSVSHNQAMYPGPCLNHKILTSLILSRFDQYILTFDLKKAFLQIMLPQYDQNRLAFLWYKNINDNDFSLIAYKNLRLPFGLRPSPCILMLALYKLLVVDSENDENYLKHVKRLIYHLIYVDNGAYTCNDRNELFSMIDVLPMIFNPYQFDIQQLVCNSVELQDQIDREYECNTDDEVKLLGSMYNRVNDKLSPQPLKLDNKAKTKREILSAINGVYDILGIYAPLLNRARIFLQKLQCDKSVDWDTPIQSNLQKEWSCITKQTNKVPVISINRFIGCRDSSYHLIAYTDASKLLYGVVIYILDINTGKLSFLMAKSRVVSTKLDMKSIPSMELHAIHFGVETMIMMYNDLAGDRVVLPLNICSLYLFTDSMVTLHWINSFTNKFEKTQKLDVFVQNRLKSIEDMCSNRPVTFMFTEGKTNPADAISRPMSYRKLTDTCFIDGPSNMFQTLSEPGILSIQVPSPLAEHGEGIECGMNLVTQETVEADCTHVVPLDKYSSLKKLIRVTSLVLKFVSLLKQRVLNEGSNDKSENMYERAVTGIIRKEQEALFPEVVSYLRNPMSSDIPSLVTRYNIIQDSRGLLRVKSKFAHDNDKYPILLPSNSLLTDMIIADEHSNINHGGIYSVLRCLRKQYWILSYFSTVKRVIKDCLICRRYNARPCKLNQNVYREFRVNPPVQPFASVFIDYIGPWTVEFNTVKRKVYLLIITCLFTRAVNLKICISADTKDFLKAIQLHVYEYGLFKECRADQGSQLTAGFNTLRNYFSDMDTVKFFDEHGMKYVIFDQFSKGHSALGSLVETLVKQVKYLVNKTIGRRVLDYFDFNLLISQTVHLINRRPVAFKETLRDKDIDVPDSITPEMLIHGYSMLSLNTIPHLQVDQSNCDPDWILEHTGVNKINSVYNKIIKCRENLTNIYHSEFLANLVHQATDNISRFKPVANVGIKVGDIVLLRDQFCKPTNFPMGRIIEIDKNDLGEVTAAMVLKSNREKVYRHSSSLIPYMNIDSDVSNVLSAQDHNSMVSDEKPKRAAAEKCADGLSNLAKAGLI